MKFKAKLIENTDYYKWKRNIAILSFCSIFILGFIQHLPYFNSWFWMTLSIPALILAVYYQAKFQKQLDGLSSKQKIEITKERITIIDIKGKRQHYPIKNAELIIVRENYRMPDENSKDIYNDLKGKPIQNYIIYTDKNVCHRFEFIIDSYYMIEQIKKLIEKWHNDGIQIKKIGSLKNPVS